MILFRHTHRCARLCDRDRYAQDGKGLDEGRSRRLTADSGLRPFQHSCLQESVTVAPAGLVHGWTCETGTGVGAAEASLISRINSRTAATAASISGAPMRPMQPMRKLSASASLPG